MIKDEDLKKLEEFKNKTISNNNKKGDVNVKESKDVKVDIDYDEIRKVIKSELNKRLEEMQKREVKGILKELYKIGDKIMYREDKNNAILKDINNKLNKLYAAALKEGSIIDEDEIRRKQEEEKRKVEEQRKKEEKAKKLMKELESLGVNLDEVKKKNVK